MDIRLQRGRPVERRVLLERQIRFFYLRWHPYERKEESLVGGSTLDVNHALPSGYGVRAQSDLVIAGVGSGVAPTPGGDRTG